MTSYKLRYQIPSEDTPASVTLSVNARSLDFGGHAELSCGVYKRPIFGIGEDDDANWNPDNTASLPIPNTSQIPRDKNYNYIADSWNNDYYALDSQGNLDPTQFRNFGNDADIDTSIGSIHIGDKLTAFEEYRGFMVWPYAPVFGRTGSDLPSVTHTRTSPDTKDLFIVNEASKTKYHGKGTEHSKISQYLVPSANVSDTGQIDFHVPAGSSAYSVKIVSNDAIEEGTPAGEALLGPPHPNHEATIYTEKIRLDIDTVNENKVISDVIGHEIGHCVHLAHCPKNDPTDANGNSWEETCLMWPDTHVNQSEYAVHHDRDYALKIDPDLPEDERNPLPPAEEDEEETPDQDEQAEQRLGTLSPVSGSYTVNAGDTHQARFVAPDPYSSVYWYVKAPSDTTTYGTNVEIDQGGGSTTTADLSYTFASDAAAGDYVIMAYVYPGTGSVYELQYTVTVSQSTPAPSFAPILFITSNTYLPGEALSPVVTCEAPIYGAHLFVRTPGDLSTYGTQIGWFPGGTTTTSLTLPYTFPDAVPGGEYKITARVYPWEGNTYGDPHYLVDYVTVSSPTPTLSFAPTLSIGSSSYSAGDSLSPVVTCELPIYGAHLYVRVPGDSSTYGTQIGWFPGGTTTTSLTLSYTFPTDAASGSYKITARVYPWDGNTYGNPDDLVDYVTVD